MEPLQTIGLVLATILLVHSAILWTWDQRLRINLLFAGLITLCISQFFPGMTNGDTYEIMLSAVHGQISDWHSPVMAIIWRFLCFFYKGPHLLFLLSQFCVWTGLYLVTKDCLGNNYLSHLPLILLVLYPPNYAGLAIVGKDTFFLSNIMLAVGCLGTGIASLKTPVRLALGIYALVVALGARHEAFFPILPIVFSYFFTKGWSGYSLPFKLGAGLGSMAVLVITLKLIEYAATERYRHIEEWMYVFDLGNLSRDTNTMLIPADCLSPHASLDLSKRVVNGDANDQMCRYIVPGTDDPVKIAELRHAWFNAVITHIPFYLHDRLNTFLAFIGVADRINFSLFQFTEVVPQD